MLSGIKVCGKLISIINNKYLISVRLDIWWDSSRCSEKPVSAGYWTFSPALLISTASECFLFVRYFFLSVCALLENSRKERMLHKLIRLKANLIRGHTEHFPDTTSRVIIPRINSVSVECTSSRPNNLVKQQYYESRDIWFSSFLVYSANMHQSISTR